MSFIFYYWHFHLIFSQTCECVNWLFLYRVNIQGLASVEVPFNLSRAVLSISALGGTSLTEGEVGFLLLEVLVTEKWIPPWLSSHRLWLIVHFGLYYLVLLLSLQHWWEVVMITINLVPIHSAQRQVYLLLLHPSSSAWRLTQYIYTQKNFTIRPFRKNWERWSQLTDGSAFYHYMAALKEYLHGKIHKVAKSGYAKLGSYPDLNTDASRRCKVTQAA